MVEFRQDRVAAAGHAAKGAALDDLGHVHGEADGKAQQRRQRGEDRRVAGAAGDDDVDIGHFIAEHVQTIDEIADTHTIITFKAF